MTQQSQSYKDEAYLDKDFGKYDPKTFVSTDIHKQSKQTDVMYIQICPNCNKELVLNANRFNRQELHVKLRTNHHFVHVDCNEQDTIMWTG